jgi:adenosylhomocysteine nucleosidase
LAIRIISDAVDDELPPEIEHLLKQKSLAGKLGAAAGAMLKRFSAAKDLWKLREDALKASDRLAKFLVGVTQHLE